MQTQPLFKPVKFTLTQPAVRQHRGTPTQCLHCGEGRASRPDSWGGAVAPALTQQRERWSGRGRRRYLGLFASEVEAAQAYDREAIQRRRLAACTNFDFTEYPELFCAPAPASTAACAHVTMEKMARSRS